MEPWTPCGTFRVGYVDIECNGDNQMRRDEIDPEQHITGRLYYPSSAEQRSRLRFSFGTSWLPSFPYAYGMAVFVFFRRPKGFLYWIAKQFVMVLGYILGRFQRVDVYHGVPLLTSSVKFPVVVFSHGIGGHRTVNSVICSELASQGYVVYALEHADGTASASRLAGNLGWKFYEGLGGEERQMAKTRMRVMEMKVALQLLRSLNKGAPFQNTKISSELLSPSTFLVDRLDMRCVAACGHSYGGATVAAVCSEEPFFRCGICLDPWWPAIYPESSALSKWRTKSPLLVLGSHDWNIPGKNGELTCDGVRQQMVLQSTCHVSSNTESPRAISGGGALLLVIAGSSHNTFADPLPLFSKHVGWLFRLLGMTARLDPVLGAHLVNISCLNFLSNHLPLSTEQRDLQSWAPSVATNKSALSRIRILKKSEEITYSSKFSIADSIRKLICSVSDYVLDRVLSASWSSRNVTTPPSANESAGTVSESPHDLITASELLESSLPSSEPSLGCHPHAPGQPAIHYPYRASTKAELPSSNKENIEGSSCEQRDWRQLGAFERSIGFQYTNRVRREHVEGYRYLLGSESIFKCEVWERVSQPPTSPFSLHGSKRSDG